MALSIVPANPGGSAFCMAYHQNSGHKSQTPFTANPKVPPAGGRFPIANWPKRARPGETAASERRPDPVPSQAQPRPAGARLAARTWPQRPSPSLGRLVRSAGRPEPDCSTNCTRRRRRRGSVELAVRREKPALPAGLSYMPAGVDERRSLEQLAHQRRVVAQQRIDDVPCSRHGRPPASSVHAAARRPVDYMGSVGRTASCQIRRDFPRGPQAGVFGGAAHTQAPDPETPGTPMGPAAPTVSCGKSRRRARHAQNPWHAHGKKHRRTPDRGGVREIGDTSCRNQKKRRQGKGRAGQARPDVGVGTTRYAAKRCGPARRDRFAGPLRPVVIPRLISKHHVTWAGASSRILTCALTWRKRGPNAMASSTCSYRRPGRLQFGACLVYIICGGGGAVT